LFDVFLFEDEEEELAGAAVVVFFPFSVRDFVERAKNTPRSKTFRTGEEEEEEEGEERLCNALKLPKASRRLVGVPESANIVILLLLLLLQNPLFLLLTSLKKKSKRR
jgi:hypothetical protein